MKSATIFIADDGTQFSDEMKCMHYECQCSDINTVMRQLGDRVKEKGCDFSNGEGYIWHSMGAVLAVRIGLLKLAQQICPHAFIDQALADPNVHESYPARIISDHGHNALNRAWTRFACIDKLGREWGQPFYANSPHMGKQVCRSDRRS